MPAYFSIEISIEKENTYEGIYADFIDILDKNGLKFLYGYWEYIDESLDSLIKWNEKLILEDYQLPLDEHRSKGYKQLILEYRSFSEVRTYIINDKENGEYVFTIIIPEDELLSMKDGHIGFNETVIEDIKNIALNLWSWPCVGAIQASLELSDGRKSIKQIREGEAPSAEPFAIIPKKYYVDALRDVRYIDIENDGVLLQIF